MPFNFNGPAQQRRWELIQKKNRDGLTPEEAEELNFLQQEARAALPQRVEIHNFERLLHNTDYDGPEDNQD